MDNTAIRVEHLSKMYHLGVINNGTLWKDIQTWAALKLGKEDPHSKIGEGCYSGDENHFWALKDISFDIKKGDRVGIIGRNGAGKSTLLKLLSRVTAPTEGSIKIKGKISSLLEVGTGFNGELTGRENIYLNGAILGMKTRQIDKRLEEIIAFSEIEHHIDTPVKRYSSGMYVRLAFAVAAHLDSDILIADEVLAVGDAAFQKKALGKMKDLSSGEGRTVLFVSHNIGAVKSLCLKGILMEKGRIIDQGDIDQIVKKYDQRTDLITQNAVKKKNDFLTRRQSGSIEFTDAKISKSEFTTDEKITMTFNVHVNDTTIGLYFFFLVKQPSGEVLTIISHVLEENTIDKGYSKHFSLEIPERSLRPGRYPVYLWIGDKLALSQNIPTNYEVLDEYLPPINIVESESDRTNIFRERLATGLVSIHSNIF